MDDTRRRETVGRRHSFEEARRCAPARTDVSIRRRRNGQSLAEFALTLPFLMLLLLVGLDFGRVFLGWVNLNNAARVAANYAAQNPLAWGSPGNASEVAEYQREISADTSGIDCTLPSTAPGPSFPSGTSIGAPAQVTLTCQFGLITPLIGSLIGNPLNVTASAAFPIRAGAIAGIPVQTVAPTATPEPTASASSSASSSASPSSSASGSASATPVASPTPSPTPMCTVPNLVGTNTSQAQAAWGPGQGSSPGAGFTTQVIFKPLPPKNYNIGTQNQPVGASLPCTSTVVTVTP